MDCHIRRHDRQQFEIKLSYPLAREHLRDAYSVEMFLFLPYSIGVHEGRYTREHFYHDRNCYTRFKTPDFALRELLDPQRATSPLTRIREQLARFPREEGWDRARLLYELRVLADVLRVRVRDEVSAIRAGFRSKGPAGTAEALGLFLSDLAAVLSEVRSVMPAFDNNSPEVARTARWADEYISLEVEAHLLRLLRLLEEYAGGEETGQARAALARAAQEEAHYRRARGCEFFRSRDRKANAALLHRESALKKFCAAVLFLSVEERAGDVQAQQLLSGFAAATAMAFATAAAWFASARWPQRSITFVLALILAYVFKDRMKELFRAYGSRVIPILASDRRGRLVDPQSGRPIGRTRETVRWKNPAQVPPEIAAARPPRDELDSAVYRPTEHILHYRKQVRIDTRRVYAAHIRSLGIDDILRVQVDGWLARMDNPREKVLHLDEGAAQTEGVSSPRLYYVDVILRLATAVAGESAIRAARLVLSKDGLVRIES